MGAAFDDLAVFHDEDLVGAADGGEAMGDDEGGAAAHEVGETFLDHGFGFGVEAGGGFVEDEDAGVGEDGAGDGDALFLAAGEFDAAFADDGFVAVGEAFDEFIDAGDAAGFEDFGFGGLGAGEGDVFADGSVEEEGFLEDDAELGAVAAELDGGEVDVIDEDAPGAGDVEGGDEADGGGFAGAGGADESGDGAGRGMEGDAAEDGFAGFVFEFDIFEADVAGEGRQRGGTAGVGILGGFVEDFAGAFEAGDGFGELGADADDLEDGGDEEAHEGGEGDEAAEGEGAGEDLAAAHVHDEGADDAEQDGGGEAEEGDAGEGLHDVVEDALGAGGKDLFFAVFGVVALDDADAAEGFGEAAGDFGGDFAAFAEDGAEGVEGVAEDEGEDGDDGEGHEGEGGADAEEDGEGEQGGEEAAGELDEAGADEIADAFDVVHDAGDELAGFVAVEVDDGEAADVGLDFAAEFGDEFLGGFGEQVGEPEAGDALEGGGAEHGEDDGGEEFDALFAEDIVDEEFGGGGQDEAGGAADDDEDEAEQELAAAGMDERADVGPDGAPVDGGGGGGRTGAGAAAGGSFREGAVAGYHKKVRLSLLFLFSSVLWAQAPAAAPAPAAEADPVVFRVGEEKMTRSEFEGLIAALPEKARTELASPQARRQFAENLSEIKALAQEARRRKISERPAVRQQIRLTEENLLANTLFQDLLAEATPSEQEVRGYYDEHKSEYETAKARHILVRFQGSRVPLREGRPDRSEEEALAEAQKLRARLVAGEKFEELAKAESDDTGSGEQGGDLGEFGRGRMVPVFDQAVFSLPVGEVSEPVKSQFGYHLILVDKRGTKPFEEMRAEIEQRQKPEKARAAAEQIRQKVAIVLDEAYFGADKPAEAPPAPAPGGQQ